MIYISVLIHGVKNIMADANRYFAIHDIYVIYAIIQIYTGVVTIWT